MLRVNYNIAFNLNNTSAPIFLNRSNKVGTNDVYIYNNINAHTSVMFLTIPIDILPIIKQLPSGQRDFVIIASPG